MVILQKPKTKIVPLRTHLTILPAILATVLLICGCKESYEYVTIQGITQGGTYHIICRLPADDDNQKTADEINGILESIDGSLSGYNKGSVLSRINGGEDLPLDSLFIKCFLRSKEIWQGSEGAFDPSAAPLFDLWGFGFEDKGSVSRQAIDSILQFVGMDLLALEERPDGTHLIKKDSRIKLNFNAIAQGFTCDIVASYLQDRGCSDYLVEIGREIVCKGLSSRGGKWRIGIDKPEDGNFDEGANLQEIIEVTDCGVVTSGNYRKFYVENGQKYAHTIDPRTGTPVQHSLLSATITALDATTADAYATWMMVIGPEAARKMLNSRPDIGACLIVSDADGSMQSWKKSI